MQGWTIWETLANTIDDPNLTLYLVLDEAHRGFNSKTTSDKPTIVRTLVNGTKVRPAIPIVWGGYFPTLYPKPVLRAPFVDWAVRGQGEQTCLDLLEVLAGHKRPEDVPGLAWNDGGTERINAERPWVGPDAFPEPRWDRIDVETYLAPTFLGRRNGVYQASIGCAYSCNFCGVIAAYGSVQRHESPARTERNLEYLASHHRMDAVHFYDNNFFLKEAHAEELCDRISRLDLRWWCEARIDAMLRFSDRTWETIRRSGLKMVYTGAESGSDERLAKMSKNLTTAQTLAFAERMKQIGIIPELSFMLGDPESPEEDVETTLAFIRRLKGINPAIEVIIYFYTPTPQRRGTYGNVDPLSSTPATLEEWVEPEWVGWMTHEDPLLPWMPRALKARVEDFQLVLQSRFPSLQDSKTAAWGKVLGRLLARRRWESGAFGDPNLLRSVRRLARRAPPDRQEYGHLRPPA
jgi:radical SAM superfamily enzyme YgiQ (UPF0313 family)